MRVDYSSVITACVPAGVRGSEDVRNLKNVRQGDVLYLCESGHSPAITAMLEAVGALHALANGHSWIWSGRVFSIFIPKLSD